MRVDFGNRILTAVRNAAIALPLLAVPAHAERPDLSNHAMLGKMDADDHYPFIAGMIEGIAFHRYTVGGKDRDGMYCIYDWFYKTDGTLDLIYRAFARYPDHPPAAVIDSLAKRECAE